MNKKRILVFSPSIVTTNAFFLESNVVESLAGDFDIYICSNTASKGSDLSIFAGKGFKGVYGHVPTSKRLKTMVFELSVNALGGRKYSRNCEIIYNMCKESYGGKFKRMLHRILGCCVLTAKWTNTFIEKYVGIDPKLQELIATVRPDVIVTFLSGGAILEIESIKIAKHSRIPVIGIQYGWDNISTWGLMPFVPDFVGVWGYQSRMFAERIHHIASDRIFHLGAPFADEFRKPQHIPLADIRQRLGLPDGKKVILFAGNIWAFNEVKTLKQLEEAIVTKQLSDCCILYRPHPFQHQQDHDLDYFEQGFKHVYLDPMVAQQYQNAKIQKKDVAMKNTKVAIDFQHIKEVFSLIDGIVAPLSTIMIQGAVCGIPSVGIAYTDQANRQYRQRYDFEEFSIVKAMPGIFMALCPQELVSSCRQVLKFSEDQSNRDLLRQYAGFAIQEDGLDVKTRLKSALDAVVARDAGSVFAYMSLANRHINIKTADEVIYDETFAG